MTYGELYRRGRDALEAAGVPEAELDARLLLEWVCGTDRNDLLAHGDRERSAGEQEEYERLIAGRKGRIPLQHLTGVQAFMGLEFAVDGHVLVPRQDTEVLVEEALRNLHDGMRILDMCTGSGCILISLLHYSNDCRGVGADISGEALAVARGNAERLLGASACAWMRDGTEVLDGCGADDPPCAEDRQGRISLIESDLFDGIEGRFDIIVSNPPYIRSGEIPGLMPEVREHEPVLALDGGEDGLDFYRRILEGCRAHLCGGGMLFLEIGYDQGEAVSGLLAEAGFLEVAVVKDYAGLDRVVCGTLGFG
ncbi:MAG: peptide chain release factor N(5)-glutamine methyltransferase [Lachnospiraceae bacterium]|nr:HemK/PrmC family methyltransferase [uncultured Acetatifactor sp.]MCI9229676.1 peptide chain release factor N(5)-glutamine methyltransferase [Lachnospiraceae bacterium]MCI9571965.1 peptide chain release factor N(5)-glutamine methyltransferase [Lachnospiraceae bacterium]